MEAGGGQTRHLYTPAAISWKKNRNWRKQVNYKNQQKIIGLNKLFFYPE
jgi:hypothetical protein